MVTRLYGIPNYREIDPTPLIAPFFAFFFGICITDAGYGFLVALVAFFAARKASPGGGRNLLKLLVIAGLATIVVGAITGGWFGININPELVYRGDLSSRAELDAGRIPDDMRQGLADKEIMLSNPSVRAEETDTEKMGRWIVTDGDSKYTILEKKDELAFNRPRALSFLTKIRILDPQGSGQMTFLGAILVIGFIQVWFGFFVKLYVDLRERDLAAAFYDELPWVLAMILLAIAAFLFLTDAPRVAVLLVVAAVIVCCSVIILFAGRESGNIVARLGTGGFELYTKITGSFGDILSYLRLFALGLATGIIGSVVNTMAGMMWTSIPLKVVAIGIFVGGHIFNLVINALGGFIHTARLQFVEFFTKFYEGGGEEFRPLKREHTYITVVDLENPQESK
jgi:vacuolar-type H+-ATPase subunit I/STV1